MSDRRPFRRVDCSRRVGCATAACGQLWRKSHCHLSVHPPLWSLTGRAGQAASRAIEFRRWFGVVRQSGLGRAGSASNTAARPRRLPAESLQDAGLTSGRRLTGRRRTRTAMTRATAGQASRGPARAPPHARRAVSP